MTVATAPESTAVDSRTPEEIGTRAARCDAIRHRYFELYRDWTSDEFDADKAVGMLAEVGLAYLLDEHYVYVEVDAIIEEVVGRPIPTPERLRDKLFCQDNDTLHLLSHHYWSRYMLLQELFYADLTDTTICKIRAMVRHEPASTCNGTAKFLKSVHRSDAEDFRDRAARVKARAIAKAAGTTPA